MADNYAIQTGDWHDSATWSTGIVPTNADDVYINGGITVTVGTSQTAVCSTLKLYTKNTVSAKGMVLLNAINSTMVVTNTIGFGDTTTATFGNIQIGGNCVTASITYASLAYNTGSSPEGIFRRVGNYQQCTITLNATTNTNFPSLENNGACIIIYANNSSITTYDKWIINGNIICSAYQSGAPSFSLFNGNICPAMHLTINGNISYTTGTNGGTSGRLIGTTSSTKEMDITLNGNIYCSVTTTSTNAYGFMMIGIPSTIYGLGKRLRIFGNIFGGSVAAFPVSVSSGNILEHVGEASVYANTYRGIELSGSAVASIGTLKPPATSLGVVSTSTDFIGNLVIDTIDCRSEASSTSNSLLLYNANTVQRETQINTIWSGGCVAYKSTSNLAHIFHVGLLNGSNYVTAPTVAAQPAINTIATPNVKSIIDVITIGNWGSWPISGWWQAKDADSLIYARDTNNATLLFSVENTSQIIPQPSDVRFGVPVGNTVGTYQLSDSYLSSIQQLRNLALAIKAKSDQMTFDGVNIEANVPATGNLISNNIQAIKTQTDKMAFETITTPPLDGDSSYANVNVLLHGFEIISGGTITDGKSNTFTVNGSLATSLANVGILSSNLYFDGNGDYINMSKPNAIGTGDFTVEARIYPTATGDDREIFSIGGTSNSNLLLEISTTNTIRFLVRGSSVTNIDLSTSTQIQLNTWSSIAATVSGTTARIFINGVLSATGTLTGTRQNDETNLKIGALATNVNRFFAGHMEELRITKGVARYVANYTVATIQFPNSATSTPGSSVTRIIASGTSSGTSGTADCDLTPITSQLSSIETTLGTIGTNITGVSTATTAIKTKTDQLSFSSGKVIADASSVDYTSQLNAITSTVNAISDAVDLIDAVTSKIAFETVYSEGDPNLAQVIFKAEFNGTNGSTVINADTGQTGTNQGSPSLNTAYARTGVSSVALSGSIVSYGNISSLNLGANDFTIEFSVNFSSIVSSAGDYAGVVGKRASNGDFSWICYVTEGKMNFLTSGINAISTAHPTVLSAGAWYDVAISRTGDTLKFYVNGVLSQVSCTGLNIATTTAPFFIGRLSYDISSYHMFGYLDRLRITVGTGRYASVAPVSPPVSEYPTTLNGVAQSYKVVANCDSGTTIPTDLTDRLTDLRNRINAIHFIVKDE